MSTASAATVYRLAGRPWVSLDLGAFMVADGSPFEIHVKRRSHHDPVQTGWGTSTAGASEPVDTAIS